MIKDIKPNKALGQNFLIDKSALGKIILSADLSKDDVVLEIGPGTGILTRELLRVAKKVIAVEKDKRMADALKDNFKDYKNLEVINNDILKLDFDVKDYKLVANIPYYITSPIIRKFLESSNPPNFMVLTIQKEVAIRICAKPPDINLLAVSVQFYAKPEIISYVSKNSFWPKPKVDSAIIKITPLVRQVSGGPTPTNFFRVVKAGFKQPRKQILNNLSSGLGISKDKTSVLLKKAGIMPEQRPETLSVQNWIELSKIFMV